jgi:hypothetical protein
LVIFNTRNASYSATVAASGGTTPYTWNATGLPAGLTIATNPDDTGTISGSFTVSLSVYDSGSPQQSACARLGLAISSQTAVISVA